jgi:hypothetical protein
MSIAVDNPQRIPLMEYVRRKVAEGEANEAADKRRRRAGATAEIIPFPATRQCRYADMVGQHLYTRSEGLRDWKRHLKRIGVAPERIEAEINTLAISLGFPKYRG